MDRDAVKEFSHWRVFQWLGVVPLGIPLLLLLGLLATLEFVLALEIAGAGKDQLTAV